MKFSTVAFAYSCHGATSTSPRTSTPGVTIEAGNWVATLPAATALAATLCVLSVVIAETGKHDQNRFLGAPLCR